MTNPCSARSTRDGYACEVCRIRWDRDDEAPPCPRLMPPAVVREPPLAYASGLAPDWLPDPFDSVLA